eukprot:CAMPEP_0172780188 /NCGR_PEP_ID=MMETSP1074-20121228/202800_1 /TAXON_ID=2916 /ORGANISM="Ceratium fusus, Strain PA161109" /LENGTH=149 /DNA_ID=CAMNT_0013617161 /DNA_START=932 /DNA_END=1378 /DNA_ORIENTATION=+
MALFAAEVPSALGAPSVLVSISSAPGALLVRCTCFIERQHFHDSALVVAESSIFKDAFGMALPAAEVPSALGALSVLVSISSALGALLLLVSISSALGALLVLVSISAAPGALVVLVSTSAALGAPAVGAKKLLGAVRVQKFKAARAQT